MAKAARLARQLSSSQRIAIDAVRQFSPTNRENSDNLASAKHRTKPTSARAVPSLRFRGATMRQGKKVMPYDGPIDLDALVSLDSPVGSGASHYTFFAFPIATLNEYGLPADSDAQHYIAAVQSTGVPIGIWLNSPVEGTGYAAVTHENISQLNEAIFGLTQFPKSYAADLCEKLFRDAALSDT